MSSFLRLINATVLSLGNQNSQIMNQAIKFISENRASFTGILKRYLSDGILDVPSSRLLDDLIDNFTLLAQICGFMDVSDVKHSNTPLTDDLHTVR